jgi:hypothetical protein
MALTAAYHATPWRHKLARMALSLSPLHPLFAAIDLLLTNK